MNKPKKSRIKNKDTVMLIVNVPQTVPVVLEESAPVKKDKDSA